MPVHVHDEVMADSRFALRSLRNGSMTVHMELVPVCVCDDVIAGIVTCRIFANRNLFLGTSPAFALPSWKCWKR